MHTQTQTSTKTHPCSPCINNNVNNPYFHTHTHTHFLGILGNKFRSYSPTVISNIIKKCMSMNCFVFLCINFIILCKKSGAIPSNTRDSANATTLVLLSQVYFWNKNSAVILRWSMNIREKAHTRYCSTQIVHLWLSEHWNLNQLAHLIRLNQVIICRIFTDSVLCPHRLF